MPGTNTYQVDIAMGRNAIRHRRDFLRFTAVGVAGYSCSWVDLLAASAGALRQRGKACILLWMAGGPSQFETFSPKPSHANGGATKAISTAVPGIEVAENFPHMAQVMADAAIIRSMTSKEGSHPRASFLLHTGYLPAASIKPPTLGSLVSQAIGDRQSELPDFVRIGKRSRNGGGAGLLGVEFEPYLIAAPDRPPTNTRPTTGVARYRRRLGLLSRLEQDASVAAGRRERADHQKLYRRTASMILSPKMRAFDLEAEPAATRDAYGRTPFGSGCLLARRLVEAGVTFVEVGVSGWDTHADNFKRTRMVAQPVDRAMAQLIRDLKRRGMLENTLVIWMGEFGRTPRINPRSGRDHYPRAFNVLLAGGGIHGGRVIGATDAGGTAVVDRPVTVPDLFRTFCRSLHIDPDQEHISRSGRPIKVVNGGRSVDALLSLQ